MQYKKYTADYFDIFDTHTQIICYAKSQSEFDSYTETIYGELSRLHRYFDIFHSYEGIDNIKTINDRAGLSPVPVSREIIGLLKFSRQAYYITDGAVNVALGPVLSIWHSYCEEGLSAPPMAELEAARAYTDIEKLVIDEEGGTVFLEQEGMSLDVGAAAKGFAAQLAVDEAKRQGAVSCLINIGGNIVTLGTPMEKGREHWGIGVQHPDAEAADSGGLLDTIYAVDTAVVTSGDYQRFYEIDSVRYHHIIDPATLMPAYRHRAVTVVHEDSFIADILSTALFILPYEKGCELANAHGAAVMWVAQDMSITTNERYDKVSKVYGDHAP